MIIKDNIILIGAPGVGKTSVGLLLANKLAVEFIDTDTIIQNKENKSIPEIFILYGEKYFRDLEIEVMSKLITSPNKKIISVGGGMPTWENNYSFLEQIGTIVLLKAKIDTLVKRIGDAKSRPLLNGSDNNWLNRLENIVNDRSAVYNRALYQIDTDLLKIEDVANQILELLKLEK
jgi:shikimate kinase